ncbi:MAG: phosphoglycerate kinase [Omnitrophica bacterium RIFCSPLOWO2_02_FULL_45_16]|nr:MAG: phosphoglycerate kinase [Omnitrophica bacterium RIFCSPHIGHO2_02_FULL_46_20]OGW94599.1 MAG: phosphoglycerate kinase [Omnitrophica bacterium RIFCSPLOWO2_01_FULL_45_24]OGW94673.1 MAG: phosphoglycerate kinase [Omnitrophica bacterium RIFCSPLOWO2_12_FULL_45_13]OGX00964.1 MAG: phosphoglycerate kinase [Omnitrophica bacterium RIFCSPLOWO2_02_FULL_45_16]
MRVDFNVPLDDKLKITDDIRIRAALPTIKYAIEKGAKVILMSHLGRPDGKVVDRMRLTPVAKRLEELLGKKVVKTDDCIGDTVKKTISTMKPGDVVLLENLRFHAEEEKDGASFAKELSSLGDVFVNDAFGTAHRAHASTEGVTKYLPSIAGFLLEKEIRYLGSAVDNPKRPFVAILGGAKVNDKIKVIDNLLNKVNALLIGGGMAYTFLNAKGKAIGSSKLDKDGFDTARLALDKAAKKNIPLLLPIDHVIGDKFDANANTKVVGEDIPDGWMGLDIGPKTIKLFEDKLKSAKTIIWNGPLGVFEMDKFAKGTEEIAKFLASLKGATTVIGGGDTAAAMSKFKVEDKMTHISTGGGASLEYLEGRGLPGIDALQDKL